MGKLAFLFAGQGAQAPGMGQSLYNAGGSAAAVFDTAEAVRPGTKEDCFTADAQRLAQTEVTQPCVFTVALAAATALAEAGVKPDGAAGFSLGEMAALTFADAFTAEEGLRLVCRRGEIMQAATGQNPGAMAAVLKLPDEAVEALCQKFDQMWPVNYNCPGQLVVAGAAGAMPDFCAAVKAAGGLAKPLAVSGAFHSPFMAAAAEVFGRCLADSAMVRPAIPVYANLTAEPYAEPLRETLARQMESPVRWTATLARMAADGYDTFIEVGPGKTLTGLAKRTLPEARLYNVQDAESLAATLAALREETP